MGGMDRSRYGYGYSTQVNKIALVRFAPVVVVAQQVTVPRDLVSLPCV
jgi:hypothetical protein